MSTGNNRTYGWITHTGIHPGTYQMRRISELEFLVQLTILQPALIYLLERAFNFVYVRFFLQTEIILH